MGGRLRLVEAVEVEAAVALQKRAARAVEEEGRLMKAAVEEEVVRAVRWMWVAVVQGAHAMRVTAEGPAVVELGFWPGVSEADASSAAEAVGRLRQGFWEGEEGERMGCVHELVPETEAEEGRRRGSGAGEGRSVGR